MYIHHGKILCDLCGQRLPSPVGKLSCPFHHAILSANEYVKGGKFAFHLAYRFDSYGFDSSANKFTFGDNSLLLCFLMYRRQVIEKNSTTNHRN